MTRRPLLSALALGRAAVTLAAAAAEAQTRRAGGGFAGGAFNRSGPAAFGGFGGRATDAGSTAARQAGATERTDTRQDGRTTRTDTRQEGRTERTQTRANTATEIADEWDDNYWVGGWGTAAAVGAGVAVGVAAGTAAAAAATPTYVAVLPCTPTVIVAGGNTYYQCGSVWYGRSYVNAEVVYVVVPPPSGN